MEKPFGIWYECACQILAWGDALGPELWLFLCLKSILILLILDSLTYMKVYEDILKYFPVFEGV